MNWVLLLVFLLFSAPQAFAETTEFDFVVDPYASTLDPWTKSTDFYINTEGKLVAEVCYVNKSLHNRPANLMVYHQSDHKFLTVDLGSFVYPVASEMQEKWFKQADHSKPACKTIDIPSFNQLTISTTETSPDGYKFVFDHGACYGHEDLYRKLNVQLGAHFGFNPLYNHCVKDQGFKISNGKNEERLKIETFFPSSEYIPKDSNEPRNIKLLGWVTHNDRSYK